VQGLLANAVLEALDQAYGFPIQALRLSDQRILANAGIDALPARSYFDVSPFVIFQEAQIQQLPELDTHVSIAAERDSDENGLFASSIRGIGKKK
jgi:hypothetical protein